jgi:site-specific DNA recombinase
MRAQDAGQLEQRPDLLPVHFPGRVRQDQPVAPPAGGLPSRDHIQPPLDAWFAGVFRPGRLPATITELTAAQADEPVPELERLRTEITETDRKLASYRAALDAGGDPTVVGAWITETQARKFAARARLDALRGLRRLA